MTESLSCPFEDEVLAADALPFARRVVIEAHLGVCSSCEALEAGVSLGEETLRALPEPPLGAVKRALERLPERRPVLHPWMLAAAVAALVFVAVRSRLPDATPPEGRVAAPFSAPADAAVDTGSDRSLPSHTTTPVAVALAPLPVIPPPVPPAGLALRRVLAAMRPGASEYDDRVGAAASEVRRRGSRGLAALSAVLAGDDRALIGPALDVAGRVDTARLVDAVAVLVPDTEFGERAAALLVRRSDPRTVRALAAGLGADVTPATVEALATLGGGDAARALAERFWTVGAVRRAHLLDATIRADAGTGAQLCMEALASATVLEPAVAAVVVRRHRAALVPHLIRDATGRDTLRTRAAARVLGCTGDPAATAVLSDLARSPRTAPAAVAALLDLESAAAHAAAFEATLAAGMDGAVAEAWDGRSTAEGALLDIVVRGADAARRAALRLLGRCGGEETVRVLHDARLPRALLGDVVDTLGAIGGDLAAERLAALPAQPGLEERVIRALGRTGSLVAVRALADLAKRHEHRRPAVVAALADLVTPESVAVLVSLLDDARAGRSALEALSDMPLGVAVPGLLRPCGDSVPLPVRRALARLAGRDLGSSPVAWRDWWAARS